MVQVLAVLAVLVLIMIGLALGTTLTVEEFKVAIKKKPKSLFIAIFLQYLVMPPFLYGIYKLGDVSKENGLGFMLVAVAPGSASSNLIAYLTKSDVALSIVATTTATALALGLMPLLLYIYVDLGGISDSVVKVDYPTVVVTAVVLIIPAFIGVMIRKRSAKAAKLVEKGGAGIGLIFLIAAVIFGVTGESHIFSADSTIWAASWLLQIWGTVTGYFVGWMAGCSHKDMRVIGIITGIQNTTLAISMASLSFSDDELRKKVLLYPLLETFCYLINCVVITLFFRFVLSKYDTKADDDALPMPTDEPKAAPVDLASSSRQDLALA